MYFYSFIDKSRHFCMSVVNIKIRRISDKLFTFFSQDGKYNILFSKDWGILFLKRHTVSVWYDNRYNAINICYISIMNNDFKNILQVTG